MADKLTDGPRLNWKAIAEITDIHEVLDAIPPKEIIARLGVPVALETIGVNQILESVGQPKGFDAKETEALFKGLMAKFTPEQIQEMLHQAKKE